MFVSTALAGGINDFLNGSRKRQSSGLAQRKRTGLIIQGSTDRNCYPLKQYETTQQFKYFMLKNTKWFQQTKNMV